ncbi:hypothetical protein [Clostridium ljungdahlii]|uniref:hypothetical protein n=1 Tax=Clostridium ljungdahlii TaxID=1538 RepID=UPI003865845A
MNIAVAAEGENLNSIVSDKFEKCLYLLIVNMNDLSIKTIKNEKPCKGLSQKTLLMRY